MNVQWKSFCGLILCGAILASTGCDSAPKEKTQKEQALQQWNQARAGVMHNLARDQFQTGNFDKARSTVDEALTVDPTSVPLHVLSARIAIEQNRLDLADKQLGEARLREPKNAEALYLSGVVAQRWRKNEQALDFYSQASEAQPTELAYLLARSEVLVQLDRRTEALSALQDKVIYFEHSAALRDAVGQLLLQERKYAEAADMFRQASVLASDDLTIKERLAIAQLQSGEARAAAEVLDGLVVDPRNANRADLYSLLGESRLQANDNVQARLAYQKATELNASLPQAWLGLGKASIALNDLRRADGAIRRAILLAPQVADAHLIQGYLRLKESRLDDAMRCFKQASAIDPKDSVSLCMIGQVLDRQGKHDEALSYYAAALKVNPNDELALRLMVSARVD